MDVKSINTNENMETFESEREHFQTNSVDKRLVRNWPGREVWRRLWNSQPSAKPIRAHADEEDDNAMVQNCSGESNLNILLLNH